MTTKYFLTVPCLLLIAGCGSGISFTELEETFEEALDEIQEELQEESDQSLSFDAEVTSFDALLELDFDNAPVGSKAQITEGVFSGGTFAVVERVGGKPTLLISGLKGTTRAVAVSGDINSYLEQANTTYDVPMQNTPQASVNGVRVINSTQPDVYTEWGLINENGEVVVRTSALQSVDGNFFLGTTRYSDDITVSQYSSPANGGNYTYQGPALAFGGQDTYSDPTAEVTINFNEGLGTFSATNFQPNGDAPVKSISITSTLAVDNLSGTISSTDGAITVGNASNSLEIVGDIAFDNAAVSGALVPTAETDGIIGGIFTLPQSPGN